MLLGVDTGGTFTDFVLFDGAALRIHKVLSTPQAPEQAILQGVRELGLSGADLQLVHGSTVATNAALEGKGVRTVYITNHGLGDVLSIGRQARPQLYQLQIPPTPVPVPPERCLETGGRLSAQGEVLEPLDTQSLARLRAQLVALEPRSVAINLLFSFLDDRFERAIEAIVPEGMFVSRSSAVLPEYREYERAMATWLNAWVGPLVEGYLRRLGDGLPDARLAVMQSSGGTVAVEQAGRDAVRLLLSGPAGGLQGARFVGRAAGCERLLSFDMGGTSTDVALIEGALRLTNDGYIGPYPVAVPMVDMHTIGAGGGSIAYVDAGGLLQVGPQSAGADPGPACYGKGGAAPTVTDANLVLGRLRPDAFLGGAMRLDVAAAERAVEALARKLGLSLVAAAQGVIDIANEHMAQALRVISVQRGEDPRDYVLTSFGGAGGLHVCALAEALGLERALVPVHAGVLSALGMLAAPRARQLSLTLSGPLAGFCDGDVAQRFEIMASSGQAALAAEGVAADRIARSASVDLRYLGQSYTLNLPWAGVAQTAAAFHALHEKRFGHRMEQAVELVNLRLALEAPAAPLRLAAWNGQPEREVVQATVAGVAASVSVWPRARLRSGQRLTGPALITETVSTTFLAPGWEARLDGVGNLHLRRGD